ncbi:C-C motif chemokine 4 homolog [Denticeps clupeoides]|uniref:C-C motif chemokine 4 homolog n=1 Tax=Denticeps clupeoides TaxID=299321 RepID=UPI0010A2FF2B|nr:C-C motif chemokine 4 homolog [Denticeps clupeoides]XP_028821421.1 C-C motif chemokine 4 homolog [Denticeps clupeoides]
MKTFCLLTAAVLLVALCSSALGQSSRPSECCMNFYQNRVPLRQIKSFTVTHPSCPKKGVVLTTLRGIKMCVNPDEQRIQDLMEKLTWGQKEGSGTGSQ